MLTLPLGRISGRALRALVTAVRNTPARAPLSRLFRAQLGIDALRALSPSARAPLPFSHAPLSARAAHERVSLELALAVPQTWPRSVASIGDRYRSGDVDPVTVVERALSHARNLAARTPTLGPLCGYDDERALAAARDSARRLSDGGARSPAPSSCVSMRWSARPPCANGASAARSAFKRAWCWPVNIV